MGHTVLRSTLTNRLITRGLKMQISRSLSSTALLSLGICFVSGHAFGQTLVGYDPNAPISNFGAPSVAHV